MTFELYWVSNNAMILTITHYRGLRLAVPSPAPRLVTTPVTNPTLKRRKNPRSSRTGVRSGTPRSRSAPSSSPNSVRKQSKKLNRTSTTFTRTTTTKRRRQLLRPERRPNSSWPVAKTPPLVAQAGSAFPSWWMLAARVPRAARRVRARSASVSCW